MCTGPHTFQRLYGLDSGDDVKEIKLQCILWGMSRSLTLIGEMNNLLRALEMLNEESEPLGLWVSRVKTRIQAFNDILDAAILSVSVCGEDIGVTERFTYLGSGIHVSAGCESVVNRHLGPAWGVMDSLDNGV